MDQILSAILKLEMSIERTLVLAKPDCMQRGLLGELISRIERKSFRLVGIKYFDRAPVELLESHYEQSKDKPYFRRNIEFVGSAPLVAMIWEGADAIAQLRLVQGRDKDAVGSFRGDFANHVTFNLMHASDAAESAEREISLWFPQIVV